MKNKLINAYIDPDNKWILIREGIDEKGREFSTSLAIPPTTGDRIDIITKDSIDDGYQLGLDIIIIIIKNGNIQIEFKK